MKTNIELLIQALETTPSGGGGICDHIRYSLDETTPRINEITRIFKAQAIAIMGYPLVALDMDYFLFPLDPNGEYQQPLYFMGKLLVNGIRAETYYNHQEQELGATRLKLIKDVLARLKSKVEIFVDHTNCYLLDGIIEQYNLTWGHLRDRKLEEGPSMNNYLIIDLKDKSLMWSENRHYPLTTLQDLITKLDRPEFDHWEILDPEIEFIAKDSDGIWWGYSTKPNFDADEDAWHGGQPTKVFRRLEPQYIPHLHTQKLSNEERQCLKLTPKNS